MGLLTLEQRLRFRPPYIKVCAVVVVVGVIAAFMTRSMTVAGSTAGLALVMIASIIGQRREKRQQQ